MDAKIPILLIVLCLQAASGQLSASPPLEAREDPEGILVSENGSPVLFYQRSPKSKDGEYQRANYIHPLYNLEGQVITEDFPADHLHQRGVFWTWHQILAGERRLGDGWECRDIQWDVLEAEAVETCGGAMLLKTRVHWKSPNWTGADGNMIPFVEEKAAITIYPAELQSRSIDFEISLRALAEGLRLGGSEDAKGYGGFSLRLLLPEDVSFRGIDGPVNPETNAVQAGPAIDVSGSRGTSGPGGITVIQHPENPGFPQGWILRSSASMQNPAWPGHNTVTLPSSNPVTLKYRLVLHGPQAPDLRDLCTRYSGKN